MFAYIAKLIDNQDSSADCLLFGILLGFVVFCLLIVDFAIVFFAHSFYPHRVELDAGAYATAVGSIAASYSMVLGATTAAYRWRNNQVPQAGVNPAPQPIPAPVPPAPAPAPGPLAVVSVGPR